MGRILCLDFGDARTGVAVSDESQYLAGGVGVIDSRRYSGLKALAGAVAGYVRKYGAEAVVIGDPINMDGTVGKRSEKAARFASAVEAVCGVKAILWDERRTTVEAADYLSQTGTFGSRRKSVIDELSAQIILQDYLDEKRKNKS